MDDKTEQQCGGTAKGKKYVLESIYVPLKKKNYQHFCKAVYIIYTCMALMNTFLSPTLESPPTFH